MKILEKIFGKKEKKGKKFTSFRSEREAQNTAGVKFKSMKKKKEERGYDV